MPFGISTLIGILKTVQAVAQMTGLPPKIVGEVVQYHWLSNFGAALKKGWDIRDLLLHVKIANLRSQKTSVMEWALDVSFADGATERYLSFVRDEATWREVLDEIPHGHSLLPIDYATVFEKNARQEGWIWFCLPMNLNEPIRFTLVAIDPKRREHVIARESMAEK